MESSVWADPALKPKLDPSFYKLQGDTLLFFKDQTGVQDEGRLKRHILDVQARAYEIFGYPCIRFLSFLEMGISLLPAYQGALSLLEKYPDAILLDIGCCFGVDIRKAVADGWPIDQVIASDLHQGFWDFGHLLFQSTPQSFPAAFVAGDAFDSALIDLSFKDVDTETSFPPLNELRSLTPMRHNISAIHASSLFHLFSEERQLELAKRLLCLLNFRSGSVIFGMHCGRREAGLWTDLERRSNFQMFCHSPDSWKKLWEDLFEDAGYGKQRVEIDATLRDVITPNPMDSSDGAPPMTWNMLVWSVKVA